MAILIEAFTVVTRIETLEQKYPGGLEAYRKSCPDWTSCMDNYLVGRIGFARLQDAEDHAVSLTEYGITYITGDEFGEIAVVDQIDGPAILPCPWLEFGSMWVMDGKQKVSVCRVKGCTSMGVAMPLKRYESYLGGQRCLAMNSGEAEKQLIYLRREKDFDVYQNVLTGQEHHRARGERRDLNA